MGDRRSSIHSRNQSGRQVLGAPGTIGSEIGEIICALMRLFVPMESGRPQPDVELREGSHRLTGAQVGPRAALLPVMICPIPSFIGPVFLALLAMIF